MELLKIETLRGICISDTVCRELTLLMNLEQDLRVTHDGYESVLRSEDILLLNTGTVCSIHGPQALLARFVISNTTFSELFSRRRYRFFCDSSMESSDNYPLLRRQLTQLLRCYYEQRDYREAALTQQTCALLIFLVTNFSTGEIISRQSSGSEELLDYIGCNYQEPLSLKQISDRFHMTPQYFSKYFKSTVGMNFYKYLSTVRLEHAVQLLLHSDSNLLRVALDSGFPNAESFYRYFQEAYGTTPMEYRIQHRKQNSEWDSQQRTVIQDALAHLGAPQTGQTAEQSVLTIRCEDRKPLEKFWAKLVNVGTARSLQNTQVRDQLKFLQDALHYKYARLVLEPVEAADDHSFYLEGQGLDYLYELGLNIWLVIDLRQSEDLHRTCRYLEMLLSHMSNRYSIDNVRCWRFELVYNTVFSDEKAALYWNFYDRIQTLLTRFGCKPLIGAGLSLGNIEGIRQFSGTLPARKQQPGLLTFQSEPYTYLETAAGAAFTRATDSSYIRNRILSLRQNIPEFCPEDRPLYITAWSNNLLPYSILNDSCYRGAEIIKNVIDCLGYVRGIAPQLPLDVMDPSSLQGKLLFGADGLVAKHGIPKPSFYSYAFLCHSGDRFLTKDAHSLVFCSKQNYQIVFHNCKRLSYRFYLDEKNLQLDRFADYFEDLEPLCLRYRLEGLTDGNYIVKIRTVTPEQGSVQDILHLMVKEPDVYIHQNDINYLRNVSVPTIRLQKITVSGGKAELSVEVPANSFGHIHLIYQY